MNDEIEKKLIKKKDKKNKQLNSTWVNLSKLQPGSCDKDNSIEKKNYETQFSINSILKDEIEKKYQLKKT